MLLVVLLHCRLLVALAAAPERAEARRRYRPERGWSRPWLRRLRYPQLAHQVGQHRQWFQALAARDYIALEVQLVVQPLPCPPPAFAIGNLRLWYV